MVAEDCNERLGIGCSIVNFGDLALGCCSCRKWTGGAQERGMQRKLVPGGCRFYCRLAQDYRGAILRHMFLTPRRWTRQR